MSQNDDDKKSFKELTGSTSARVVCGDPLGVPIPVSVDAITVGDVNVDIQSDHLSTFTPANKTVDTTAGGIILAAGASNLSGRNFLKFQPEGTIFIGATGVTASTGIRIAKNQIVTFVLENDTVDIFAITNAGSTTVRLWEGVVT